MLETGVSEARAGCTSRARRVARGRATASASTTAGALSSKA